MNSFLIFSVLVAAASAASVHIKDDIEIRDCGELLQFIFQCYVCILMSNVVIGSKATITRIEFDQCSEFPCVVNHGTTATGRAHMVANTATDTLTCKVN